MQRLVLCGLVAPALTLALVGACNKDDEDKKATAGGTDPKAAGGAGGGAGSEKPAELGPEQLLARVEGCWAALSAWDKEAVRDCYPEETENFVVDSVPPETSKTQQESLVRVGAFRNAFPDFKADLQLVLLSGRKAVAVGLITGTHKGRTLGIPPTGKPVSLLQAQVTELDPAGRFARERDYVDQMTLLHQLGIQESAMAPAKEAPWPQKVRLAAAGDATEKANLDTFKASFEAGNKEDLAGWMARYADDAELRYAAVGQAVEGKKSIEAVNQAYFAQHDQLVFTLRDAWAAGEWVVAETGTKGALASDIGGVKGTKGKKWELAQLELLQFAGGKVKRHLVLSNYLKFYIDTGIVDQESLGGQ